MANEFREKIESIIDNKVQTGFDQEVLNGRDVANLVLFAIDEAIPKYQDENIALLVDKSEYLSGRNDAITETRKAFGLEEKNE